MSSVAETKEETEIKASTGNPLDPGEAHIRFSEKWFGHDSLVYDHNLGKLCAYISMIGYDMSVPNDENSVQDKGIKYVLEALEMKDVETYSVSEREEVNYVFAHRDIEVKGENFDLITLAFIGSRFEQWYDNFDSGLGETHKGFNRAMEFVYSRLENYLADKGMKKETTKFLITGHSRGGATANLLGAKLIKEEKLAESKNIFTYTFAAPAPTKLEERNDEKFRRIFNIVNDEDFVPRCMPREWGYGRYGITYALPHKNNTENYEEVLGEMQKLYGSYVKGAVYKPFKDGPEQVNKLFATLSASVQNIYEFYHTTYKCAGKSLSLQEYFTQTLCGITAEPAGSKKANDATIFMMMTSVRRLETHPIIRAVADFFILYEGLGGATKGNISDTYFTYSHDINTYCAFMNVIDEKQLMAIQVKENASAE